MVESDVVKTVQNYLAVVHQSGIQVSRAVLYGSYARGEANAESDIDILVIAAEFDGPYDRRRADLLWELRTKTDSRIEPLPVGERQWQEDDTSMIIEIARREGQEILYSTQDQTLEAVNRVVSRIVQVAHPTQVIWFGSGARGDMGPNSDLDFLVIVPGPVHRGRLTEEIYLNLFGVGHPADVVVVTQEDVDRYRDNPFLVIEPAMQEGKVVYDARAPVAG